MRTLHSLWYSVKTFSKGIFILFVAKLLLVSSLFIFDSCKKTAFKKNSNGEAKGRFLSALELNRKKIGATTFLNKSKTRTTLSPVARTEEESYGCELIYLEFPSETNAETRNMIYSTTSVEELSNLIDYSNAVVQYDSTSTNYDYQLQIPVQNVVNSLNPLIAEAKQYLYAKGFTGQDIDDMLIEESGKEEDLIPFVMALTQAENSQSVVRNYSSFFVTSAHANLDANDYIRCAAIAIGADVLWSLGGSSASAWTVASMKTAFRSVAKRMLGPIGVAIAVVSFGICIAEAYYD